MPLARLRRAGARTPGSVPQGADAALRDLRRARAEARRALQTANQRLTAVLLRHDLRSTGQATWGPAPLRWLRAVGWPTPAPPSVCQASVRAVTDHRARLARLAQDLHDCVQPWRLQPVVDARQALRGGPCTGAVPLVAALGDLPRVDKPSQRMRALGLTPADSCTGDHRPPGALTPPGKAHARRARSAGAWADRYPAKGRRPLPWRVAKGPQAIQAIRWQAPGRRCQR